MDREEIDLLLDTAKRWFHSNQPLQERVAAFREGNREGIGAWKQMADMGWLSLSLPEALDGFGASHSACFELIREAGHEARPEPLELHLVLAPLLAAALPEYAQGMAKGQIRLGLCDVAQGPNAVHLTDRETLDGTAGTVLGGEHVTHLLLPVAQGHGMSLVLVLLQAAGVNGRAARLVDSRATLQLSFTSTPAQRLGGADLAQRALDRAAASLVADSAGVLDAAFALTLDYLKQRFQFGKPLSAQQVVQHKMAEVFCDLQQLLALSARVAAELDTEPDGPWPTLAPAKSFIGRRALRAAGQLIQVSGGVALAEDYKLTHFYRRLHVAGTLFGAAEAQLARIEVRQQLLAA